MDAVGSSGNPPPDMKADHLADDTNAKPSAACRGQAPKPRSGAPKAQSLRAARSAEAYWSMSSVTAASDTVRQVEYQVLHLLQSCTASFFRSGTTPLSSPHRHECRRAVRSSVALEEIQLQQSAMRDSGRSGQERPYVRPVARLKPLAIMGVRLRARHQSQPRARGATCYTVLPEPSCDRQPFPSRCPAGPAGSTELAPGCLSSDLTAYPAVSVGRGRPVGR
jgi:hypothetical protein